MRHVGHFMVLRKTESPKTHRYRAELSVVYCGISLILSLSRQISLYRKRYNRLLSLPLYAFGISMFSVTAFVTIFKSLQKVLAFLINLCVTLKGLEGFCLHCFAFSFEKISVSKFWFLTYVCGFGVWLTWLISVDNYSFLSFVRNSKEDVLTDSEHVR